MSRAARLLEILITLGTQNRFTVAELADQFGVSRRTMLRDLHELSAMGVPLHATPGPHGGYGLLPSRRLLPFSLTADEAIGVLLSYEALQQYPQTPFSAQSLSAITKLRSVLPADVIREIDRIHQYVVISEAERRYDAPLLADLLAAALNGTHLRVVYDSRSGVAERVIFPFGLYAAAGYWYCACYDYKRRRNLSLRADRFRAAEPVEGYERPHELSLRDWLCIRERNAQHPVRLRLRVTPRGMKSFDLTTLFGSELKEQPSGGLIDTLIPIEEIDFFAASLIALGTEVVIESPPELIAAIRAKARDLLGLYADDAQLPESVAAE